MNFFDKNTLHEFLTALPDDRAPLWGMMTPQHMVEHLSFATSFSNGKMPMPLAIPEEKVERAKARLLAPEWQMPMLFKASFMPTDNLPPLAFATKSEAIDALLGQIDDFYDFYAQNPEATPIHPYFGPLNRAEWEVLHHKHFYHHLKQFGMVG